MSVLFLVRHGQATLDGDDYDQLSPLGEEQSATLGEYWADHDLRFDRILVGPRRRHHQTHAAVRSVFESRGLPWPEPEPLDALDEHQGPEILVHHREELEAELETAQPVRVEGEGDNPMRQYLRLFRHGSVRWALGDLDTPSGFEDWQTFRERVAAGVDHVVDTTADRGQRVAAFTSGGTISAAVGHVLGLDDDPVVRLGWRVRNASVSELHFSAAGVGLGSFNAVPHFREPRFVTYV